MDDTSTRRRPMQRLSRSMRFYAELPVEVSTLGMRSPISMTTVNLSRSGLLVRAHKDHLPTPFFVARTLVEIEIRPHPPLFDSMMRLTAKVIRSQENISGHATEYGLQIIDLEDSHSWERFIEQLHEMAELGKIIWKE